MDNEAHKNYQESEQNAEWDDERDEWDEDDLWEPTRNTERMALTISLILLVLFVLGIWKSLEIVAQLL